MRRLIPFALLAVALAAPRAHAVAKTWNGSVNIQWNNGANWTPAGVPTAADDVTINVPGTVRISNNPIAADAVAASLTIGAAVTMNRGNGHILTVTNGINVNSTSDVLIQVPFTAASLSKSGTGNLTLNGAALSGTTPQVSGTVDVTGGTLTLNGGNDLTTGGAVNVSTGATLARNGAGFLNAGGAVTVDGGAMTFAAGGGLAASATVTVMGGGTVSFAGGGGLTSGGAVTVTGGTMSFAAAGGLTSGGGVNVTGGTITFAGGGDLASATSMVTVGAGGTLAFPGNANLGAGDVIVNGGIVSFGGNGDLIATGGVTVTGGGSLSFGGNGDITAQSFTLASGSSFTLNFATGGNPTNINLTGGTGALGGTVNITGTPNAASFNILTGASTVDITGVMLGSAPSGLAFGFRPLGTSTVVLDVTVNPIAPDGTASATGSCPGPMTWQHTISATANDRYLLVGVSTGTSAVTPTAVSFGAQPMGLIASRVNGSSGAFIYGLVAPGRGTGTITVTLPAGPCSVVAGSLSYTGVLQASSTGTAATAAGTGTSASASPSTVQGDKVIAVLASNGATSATPQAGATVRWSAIQGTVLGAGDTASRSGAGTFNVTMSWTLSPSSEFALASVPIHAAAPTRVMEIAASVRRSGTALAVSVRSGPRSDLVGFRVWREAAGQRELLTPGLVEGPVLTSRASLLAGSESGWVDARPVPGANYLIEALHLNGRTTWSRAAPGAGPAPPVASALLASPASAVVVHQPALRVSAAEPVSRRSALVMQGTQWQLAADAAVKMRVSTAGLVRVPAELLFAAGIPVGAAASSIQLFRGGRPVPRTVDASDGVTLRSGDAVEFYGYPMDTRYSGSAVYWLTAGKGVGVEVPSTGWIAPGAATRSYLASAEVRERLTWFGAARNGDAEKFFGPAVHSTARQRTIPVDALDVSGAGARLELAFQGLTEIPHAVSVSVNGLPVASVTFDGNTPHSALVPLPPGTLVAGDNTVELVAPGSADISLEQYVRLVYPRFTVRGSGALEFTLAGGAATRLDGFDPGLTRVLDITDPDAPVRLTTWDESGAAAVAAPGSGSRRLLAYLPTDVASPVSVVANRPSSWHSAEGADLIIVGPASLLPEAQALVDARRAQGLSVALVDVEDVQDEFASGEKSADALRGFLQQALGAWARPPRYILLLGSATYDPRDYLRLGGDLVPSGTVQTEVQMNGQTEALEAASDSWFLGVPGAGALSIGRLPVRTAEETRAVVAKIVGRRDADAKANVLLVSDRAGTSDFPEMSADLRAVLPDAQATVLVRGSDTDQVLHQRMLEALRASPALVNYIGHAAETFWSDPTAPLFSVDDVSAVAGNQPGLWIDMSCLTAFFQDPRRQSLDVATLLASEGGAWGTWGSTAKTYPGDHAGLNRALVRALLIEGKTLGEATRDALASATDPQVQSTFVLLGDPSARAVATAALEVAPPKPSASSGCSATPAGSGTLALLAIGLWWAAARRRVRVGVRRE